MSQDPKSGRAADDQQNPNTTNDSGTAEAKEQRRKEELEKAKKEEEDKPVSSGSVESDTLGQNSWFENDGTSGIDMP
jgi:hypothetical protein